MFFRCMKLIFDMMGNYRKNENVSDVLDVFVQQQECYITQTLYLSVGEIEIKRKSASFINPKYLKNRMKNTYFNSERLLYISFLN